MTTKYSDGYRDRRRYRVLCSVNSFCPHKSISLLLGENLVILRLGIFVFELQLSTTGLGLQLVSGKKDLLYLSYESCTKSTI